MNLNVRDSAIPTAMLFGVGLGKLEQQLHPLTTVFESRFSATISERWFSDDTHLLKPSCLRRLVLS